MRLKFATLVLTLVTSVCLQAQQYFPVKQNKKWGLINTEGEIVLPPEYDAIGEFKRFGYAIMQKNGGVGMLNRFGFEVIPPLYNDIKVLDSTLIAVMEQGEWMVINLQQEIILNKGYERIQIWDRQYLAYMENGKWGVVDKHGRVISKPSYDDLQLESKGLFITTKAEKIGLLSAKGTEILENIAEEIKIFNDSLFFFKKGNHWGAVNNSGNIVIPPRYDNYKKVSDSFIKLLANNKLFIYSIACKNLITQGQYDDYYSFSKRYVIVKKDRQLGLIDWCGRLILSPKYYEIQSYGRKLFRVNYGGKWGVVRPDETPLIPFAYDYIAPIRGKLCLVKRDQLFGIVNFRGEEVVKPAYHRIELNNNQAKAYVNKNGSDSESVLSLLKFNKEGKLTDNNSFDNHFQIKIVGKSDSANTENLHVDENDYLLDDYEWFYSPEEDRWGLRKLSDGSIQIEPIFHYIQVERDLGFTLVGIEKFGKYEFERTTFRFELIYGLVKNDIGLLVTEVDFWDVRFSDFERGFPVARVIFSNGRHGLVDRIGKIIRKDFAYIGSFEEGAARMSIQGQLSGSIKKQKSLGKLGTYLSDMLSVNYRVDYTQYDQLFQQEATLTCNDCEWGYIDTAGQVIVPPTYSFAEDIINMVGIVECAGKWGMIDKTGKILIPCQYDGVQFLENTDNKIVKIYIQQPKYGLIDTLGQLTVSAVYDEIGQFSEGRLAVKRNGMWGFVDSNGLEVIPCRFRDVSNFSEGLAAVKLGQYWGFIDKMANVDIGFKYRRVGNFKEGLAWVYEGEGVGYIDKEQNAIIPPIFDKAHDFEQGVARVMKNKDYGLIDRNGKFIQKPRYSDIQPFDQYGLAIVRYGNERIRYGLINLRGEQVTRVSFNSIEPFQEGLAAVKFRDNYGFIDTTGQLVIPNIYSKVSGFAEGRAAVQKDGQCGYIDRNGNTVIPFNFSKCLDYDDGKAVVYKGIRKAGLIDMEGAFIFEPSLNRLLQFKDGRGLMRDNKYRFYYITEQAGLYNGYYQQASEFKYGVAVVKIDEKWGIINQKGIAIIPPKYDKIESFEDGYAKVRIKGFSGLSNLKGELIVQPDYEFISYAGDGLFRVEQGDKVGYFDVNGEWIWGLSK